MRRAEASNGQRTGRRKKKERERNAAMRSRPRGVDRESDPPPAMIIPTVERHQLNSSPSFLLEDGVFSLSPPPPLSLSLRICTLPRATTDARVAVEKIQLYTLLGRKRRKGGERDGTFSQRRETEDPFYN